MKNYFISILAVLLFVTMLSTQKSFGQINLSGSWTAKCALEMRDKITVSYCDICPSKISKDKKTLSMIDFEMVFTKDKDSLKLIINNVTTQVVYKLDEELETLEFTFKGKANIFKILFFHNENNFILKDNDGGDLIMLVKK